MKLAFSLLLIASAIFFALVGQGPRVVASVALLAAIWVA